MIYLKGLGDGRHVVPGPGDEPCDCARCEAAYLSEGWKDSLVQGEGGSNAEETLPLIARWWDVKRAVDAVVIEKRDREVVQLRASGYTEGEIAAITGLARSMVRRRFEAKVADLLEQLGGEYVEPPRVSVPSKCLSCGVGERVYLVPTRSERWACIGSRRDPEGRLCQAWQCRAEVMLRRRALVAAARVGQVFALTWTIDRGARCRVIDTREVERDHFPAGHPWVQGWERDTKLAELDRTPPVRSWRVPTEVEDRKPGRQSALCLECVTSPTVRRRVEQSRRVGRQ